MTEELRFDLFFSALFSNAVAPDVSLRLTYFSSQSCVLIVVAILVRHVPIRQNDNVGRVAVSVRMVRIGDSRSRDEG